MAYTARKLITKAYYLSGIVSRTLQTVSGEQLADGLELLNALLAVKTADQHLVPYYKEHQFNAIVGQEKYFIPNLITISTMVFDLDTVRYPMQRTGRDKYQGSGRAENIQSLPFNWNIERAKGGATVSLYFLPQSPYLMKLWGKFGLYEVASENEDLSAVYDNFYIEYLRYALAEYICADYNIVLQPQTAQRLRELETTLTDISPPDLAMQKVSTLQSDTTLNYGDINIGKGWRPS